MENLTLPEPAASLWAAKRSIVHAIPPEMFGRIEAKYQGDIETRTRHAPEEIVARRGGLLAPPGLALSFVGGAP